MPVENCTAMSILFTISVVISAISIYNSSINCSIPSTVSYFYVLIIYVVPLISVGFLNIDLGL